MSEPKTKSTTATNSTVPTQTDDVSVVKDGDTHTGKNKKRRYIVEYRRDVCIGAASCAAIAGKTFQMDDENKAYIVEEGEWDEEDIILAAAQSCPVFAIIIKDAETGKQIFPEIEDAPDSASLAAGQALSDNLPPELPLAA